jgi:4-hydroxy-tetrahydrodipicolinate synthase
MQIRGVIPPVATPMLPNEDLDLPRLRWFLDRLIAHGVHGVFVLGTNSAAGKGVRNLFYCRRRK